MGHFMKFGYARVSSNTQDHAAQIEALKADMRTAGVLR